MNGKVFLLAMILAGAAADATPVFESTSSDIFDPSGDPETAPMIEVGEGGASNRHSMVRPSGGIVLSGTTIGPIIGNVVRDLFNILRALSPDNGPRVLFPDDDPRPFGGLDDSDLL